jgi:hypothetical protein
VLEAMDGGAAAAVANGGLVDRGMERGVERLDRSKALSGADDLEKRLADDGSGSRRTVGLSACCVASATSDGKMARKPRSIAASSPLRIPSSRSCGMVRATVEVVGITVRPG